MVIIVPGFSQVLSSGSNFPHMTNNQVYFFDMSPELMCNVPEKGLSSKSPY